VVFNSERDSDGRGPEFGIRAIQEEEPAGRFGESGPRDFELRRRFAGGDRFGMAGEQHTGAKFELDLEFGAVAVKGKRGGDFVRIMSHGGASEDDQTQRNRGSM
jgi:hypothetical protein